MSFGGMVSVILGSHPTKEFLILLMSSRETYLFWLRANRARVVCDADGGMGIS